MTINYSGLTTALGDLLIVPITNPASATPSSDTNFNNILPRIIDAGEQRIYRDCDFLTTRTTDYSTNLTSNSRQAALPTASLFVVVEGVNVITPIGAATPAAGKRNRLEIVSKDFLDVIWPVEQGGAYNTLPTYGVLLNTSTLIVAPTPDQNYMLEYTGTVRPAPMSASNTTTYLGTTYPDFFLAACMSFGFMYQRDVDAPAPGQQAMSALWEANYNTLKAEVIEEVQRQKTQGRNWSAYSQTPLSNPPRP